MKLYARQINPENQESPWEYDKEQYEDCIIQGNSRLMGQTTEAYDIIVQNYDFGVQSTLDKLTEITTKEYAHTTIRGCSQSDWNDVYYPLGEVDIKRLEADYFNLGTEFLCMYSDDEIEDFNEPFYDDFTMYCYESDYDNIKIEIASQEGIEPADVVLLKFDGYKKTPIYKIY